MFHVSQGAHQCAMRFPMTGKGITPINEDIKDADGGRYRDKFLGGICMNCNVNGSIFHENTRTVDCWHVVVYEALPDTSRMVAVNIVAVGQGEVVWGV